MRTEGVERLLRCSLTLSRDQEHSVLITPTLSSLQGHCTYTLICRSHAAHYMKRGEILIEGGVYYVGGETLLQDDDIPPTMPVWRFDLKTKDFEQLDIECW